MKSVSSLIILFLSLNLFAHGEDKPGPNGGFIQMPGNFHTEVVPVKDGSFMVFLLDLQFQNPSIKDSSVEVTLVKGKKKQPVSCMAMGEHFHCKPTSSLKSGTLVILPKREGTVGMEAKYKLPLKFAKANSKAPTTTPAPNNGHAHH